MAFRPVIGDRHEIERFMQPDGERNEAGADPFEPGMVLVSGFLGQRWPHSSIGSDERHAAHFVFDFGANPRRSVFSVTLIGTTNCSR